jgi:hypothetical protein
LGPQLLSALAWFALIWASEAGMGRSLRDGVGAVLTVPSSIAFVNLARTRTIIPHNPAKYGKLRGFSRLVGAMPTSS